MDNITDYIAQCKSTHEQLVAERAEAERKAKEAEAAKKAAEAAERKAREDEILAPYPELVRSYVISINGTQVEIKLPNVARFWAVHSGIAADDARFQFVDENDNSYNTNNIAELIGMLAE